MAVAEKGNALASTRTAMEHSTIHHEVLYGGILIASMVDEMPPTSDDPNPMCTVVWFLSKKHSTPMTSK